DFFLHLDSHLSAIISHYGSLTYVLLFVIIFCETGFVVTPFLPGDSLLFAAGTFAALHSLSLWILFLILVFAAILGDTINYWIGRTIGHRIVESRTRWISQKGMERTNLFFAKHGGLAIFLGRFVPIIRTFIPFIAGFGSMKYRRFLAFNVIGGTLWVSLFLFGGFLFGNIPIVKKNFSFVILAIIVISLIPVLIEFWHARKSQTDVKK
ncbi:MAG TPA: DedA family protein, partial [Patescibacteria group bacterium]|nr:DedA family protein [Patescibacteria group bacterium]